MCIEYRDELKQRGVAEYLAGKGRRRDASFGAFVAKWKPKYPRLAVCSERAGHVLTSCEFPAGLRRLIYTNNRVESFNKQLRRMPKKQIQFVTEEAL